MMYTSENIYVLTNSVYSHHQSLSFEVFLLSKWIPFQQSTSNTKYTYIDKGKEFVTFYMPFLISKNWYFRRSFDWIHKHYLSFNSCLCFSLSDPFNPSSDFCLSRLKRIRTMFPNSTELIKRRSMIGNKNHKSSAECSII